MSREKLAALKAKVAARAAETKAVKVEVEAARSARRVVLVPAQSIASEVVKQVKASSVERWFKEELSELFGADFIVPKWTVKQNTLAKRLLTDYGSDLTEAAVRQFCKGWRDLVKGSRGRISGSPTISLLWSMRERIYAEVQNGKKMVLPVNSDEYRDDDGSPDAGW
jgi:hypothetical protein